MPQILVVLLACLALPCGAFAQSLTAGEILQKVHDTYASPRTLQVESTTFWGVRTGNRVTRHEESRARIAMEGRDKLFMEKAGGQAHYVRVADGRNTWFYLPERNRYDVAKSAASAGEVDEMFLYRYREFFRAASSARVLREETIMQQGEPVPCYVVEIDTTASAYPFKSTPAIYTWWVDQRRFVVWREEHAKKVRLKKADAEQFSLTDVSVVKVNEPIAPEMFIFTPPAGSKKVKALGAQ